MANKHNRYNKKVVKQDTTNINNMIVADYVMLLSTNNDEKPDKIRLEQALLLAQNAGLDLVQMGKGKDDVPVCKILDYEKYKYNQKKQNKLKERNSKIVVLKEIKVRSNIAKGDLDIKIKQTRKFIEDGNRVKITIRFKGREMLHQEFGVNVLKTIIDEVSDIAKVEKQLEKQGNQIFSILAKNK